ncbi:MAG: hypothetical protein KDC26_08255 [Armatimonadetes bacterium]|nr:hypothetical protein [Armatimonadota bacterium]
MRAFLFNISVLFCASFGFAQNDPLTRPNGWASVPMATKNSSEMVALQTKVNNTIEYLKKDSLQNRQSKLRNWAEQKYSGFAGEGSRAYEAGRIAIEFREELKSIPKGSAFALYIVNSEGMPDPEFQRVAYICTMYDNGLYFGWKDLGLKLRKMFPRDMELVESLYRDCILGKPTLAMIDMVLADTKANPGKKLSAYDIQTRETNMSKAVFGVTRKKSDLLEAIRMHEEMMVAAKKAQNTKHIRVLTNWISFLKSELTNKNFVGG